MEQTLKNRVYQEYELLRETLISLSEWIEEAEFDQGLPHMAVTLAPLLTMKAEDMEEDDTFMCARFIVLANTLKAFVELCNDGELELDDELRAIASILQPLAGYALQFANVIQAVTP